MEQDIEGGQEDHEQGRPRSLAHRLELLDKCGGHVA
jgi:hypothetical protein